MSKPGQPFVGLLPDQTTRPKSHFTGPAGPWNLLRDQLTIPTWLAIGAAAQALAYSILGLYAFLPATVYLILTTLDTIAITYNFRSNPYTASTLPAKFSAQIPSPSGNFSSTPADSDVVVFLIGSRCNHPLGFLAPGFPKLFTYFQSMVTDLESHAEEFGLLGITSWTNSATRTSKSEFLEVCYFRSVEGLHAFAHSELHRKGWNWWNKNTKQFPYISIYHETYHVPAGHWENIFVNSHASGIASTTFKVQDKESGEDRWMSGVVDASKGLLKTSAGRMGRSAKADEHESYGEDPYQ